MSTFCGYWGAIHGGSEETEVDACGARLAAEIEIVLTGECARCSFCLHSIRILQSATLILPRYRPQLTQGRIFKIFSH